MSEISQHNYSEYIDSKDLKYNYEKYMKYIYTDDYVTINKEPPMNID